MATKDEKIACLKREIAMRQRVYTKWVASGRMKQDEANREIDTMIAILRDYIPEQPERSTGP
jgi:hypothetical protein